jgi:ubiquinol-cytochrome c reductase iron-sulfur subunit
MTRDLASTAGAGGSAVPADQDGYRDHQPTAGAAGQDLATVDGARLPARFPDPGIPEHQHRMADIDPVAARRAERQVATLFGLSAVGTLLVIVSYFAVKLEFTQNQSLSYQLGRIQLSTTLLGVGMFISLFGIGAGAVHWAKTLMPDDEQVELRHAQRGSDADRADAVAILKGGAEESGLGRRPLIRNSLLGAMALFPLPGLVFLRDLGPLPHTALETTLWVKDRALVKDPEGGKIKASDVQLGSVVHVIPEGLDEKLPHYLDEKAKAAVLLIRMNAQDLDEKSRAGAYDGIIAYSKICTHLGCPVALYEQQTHHLLCPCHQSTFDLTQGCKVIFGPAKRPLPQLAITVDAEGYLVAASGFTEPVGPSFWERS